MFWTSFPEVPASMLEPFFRLKRKSKHPVFLYATYPFAALAKNIALLEEETSTITLKWRCRIKPIWLECHFAQYNKAESKVCSSTSYGRFTVFNCAGYTLRTQPSKMGIQFTDLVRKGGRVGQPWAGYLSRRSKLGCKPSLHCSTAVQLLCHEAPCVTWINSGDKRRECCTTFKTSKADLSFHKLQPIFPGSSWQQTHCIFDSDCT